MTARASDARCDTWSDALLAAHLFAMDPAGTGGVVVHAAPGPVRDAWLDYVRMHLPAAAPVRRVPQHISMDRLLGGLDLGATLASGRRCLEAGALAGAHGGVVIAAMSERWSLDAAAPIAAALDTGEIVIERDGLQARSPAAFGLIALDEGTPDDPRPPAAWTDRLAFHVDLDAISVADTAKCAPPVNTPGPPLDAACAFAPVDRRIVQALCVTALKLGILSLRAPLQALQVARLHAALNGRSAVTDDDAGVGARLVLSPRALIAPEQQADAGETDAPPPSPEPQADTGNSDSSAATDQDTSAGELDDVILAAALAALPPGLLDTLKPQAALTSSAAADGRSGAPRRAANRGRSTGIQRASHSRNARLDILATLRAAAPWQRLRAAEAGWTAAVRSSASRVQIRRDDFRVRRFKHQTGSTIVFAVDASGSSALHRLAEAKGAVELLLADCYARRDRVALVAFRGLSAELLLPQSRSLVRAKRCLAGLPGGGGTPLAAGLDAACSVAIAARRKGDTPLIVLMTDGRANVTRAGKGGRPEAERDSRAAARAIKSAAIMALLIDTSPQPNAFAATVAADMGGRYVPLPRADANAISTTIQAERVSSRRHV